MLTRSIHVAIGFVFATSSFIGACGRCPRAPTFAYEGESRAPKATGVLPRLDAIPLGFEVLGNISAHCERERPRHEHVKLTLGTLLCSAQSLTVVLDEMAREAGGTALFQTRCARTGASDSDVFKDSGTYYECSAQVLAPSLPESAVLKTSTASATPGTSGTSGRARLRSKAWVEFDATAPIGESWPSAVEVPFQPIADRRVGLLRVTVGAGGAREDALQATFDAAAAFGANHVIAPNCTPANRARFSTCVAWVSAPEQDPRRDPKVR